MKLKIEKTKIAELTNPEKIKGGIGVTQGETGPRQLCLKTSEVVVDIQE